MLCADEKPIWTAWIIILYVFNPIMWQSFAVIGLSWMGRLIPHTQEVSGAPLWILQLPYRMIYCNFTTKGSCQRTLQKAATIYQLPLYLLLFKTPIALKVVLWFQMFYWSLRTYISFCSANQSCVQKIVFPPPLESDNELKVQGTEKRGGLVLWHLQSSPCVAYVTDHPQHRD